MTFAVKCIFPSTGDKVNLASTLLGASFVLGLIKSPGMEYFSFIFPGTLLEITASLVKALLVNLPGELASDLEEEEDITDLFLFPVNLTTTSPLGGCPGLQPGVTSTVSSSLDSMNRLLDPALWGLYLYSGGDEEEDPEDIEDGGAGLEDVLVWTFPWTSCRGWVPAQETGLGPDDVVRFLVDPVAVLS